MESEFTRLALVLEADGAKRESIGKEVRELNRIYRNIQFALQKVHNVCNDAAQIAAVCAAARGMFAELSPVWSRIFAIIGSDENVEKYRAHWRFVSEQLAFLASFTHWMDTRQLISIAETQTLIGCGANEGSAVPTVPSTAAASSAASSSAPASGAALPPGVGLDLDDYLQGLTALPKELCRLCVNCVRVGNYSMPRQIAAFIAELYSGFRLLNLRNDALRRKFDGIKYDLQKIEEVLYDMTVRGLGTEKDGTAATADTKTMAAGTNAAAAGGESAMQS